VFSAKNEKGKTETLLLSADTKIIKHTKIQSKANPYDKEWYDYFIQLEGIRMYDGYKGRKELLKLWNKQKGKCPICMGEVNKESGWQLHKDSNGNRYILHPNCYKKVDKKEIDMLVNGDSHKLRTA
jgi:RNA-directed DNA polymerase